MLRVAVIALVISVLLSAGAIVSFLWSTATARWLIIMANGAAGLGAIEVVLAGELRGIGNWALLFACGSCGCGVVAVRHVEHRLERRVHRFVIYAGYAATFAAMGAVGLWLVAAEASGKVAAAVFVGVYIAGSAGVFVAKTLTLARTTKWATPPTPPS